LPDRKSADLTGGTSCCVAYLDSLPFQEGTLLAPTEEHTPREVGTTDSGLGSPDLLLPEKFKLLGITKYDVKQDPVQ
jgi:hypothetical protein